MTKLYATYAVAALAPVILFILVQIPLVWHWHAIQTAQQTRTKITEDVLRLHRLAVDIENGFRGYVLTKQAAFLHPVVNAEAKVQGVLDHLLEVTKDRQSLHVRIKVLHARIHELIETKRRLTKQIDGGDQESVMSYIQYGDGLALSKTIEKAMEDLEVRIAEEFSRADVDETTLREGMFLKLLIADLGTLLLGILVTRVVVRAATDPTGFATSK